jgi:hypothetical protein
MKPAEEIDFIAEDLKDWLDGIVSTAEEGEIGDGDMRYIVQVLREIEERLQRVTTEIIQDR